jgi:hypothetical protein
MYIYNVTITHIYAVFYIHGNQDLNLNPFICECLEKIKIYAFVLENGCLKSGQQISFIWAAKLLLWAATSLFFWAAKNFFFGSEIIFLSSKIIYLGSKF